VRQERAGKKIRVFLMDEARFGQQGTLTKMWAMRGTRPVAVKQTKYEWVYLYGAVDPATGDSAALLLPYVNTECMNLFLKVLSETLGPDEHAVLVMDNAGWHHSKRLEMPENITPLFLPPYSPELNSIERLWAYLKSHFLSNRAYADYQALLDAGSAAWCTLTNALIRSICATTWLTPNSQT
jgi:transposase